MFCGELFSILRSDIANWYSDVQVFGSLAKAPFFCRLAAKSRAGEALYKFAFRGVFLSLLSAEHRRPFNVLCQGGRATRGKKIFSQSLHKAAFAACKTVCRLVLIVCRLVDFFHKRKRLKIYQLAKNKAGSCRRFQKEISGWSPEQERGILFARCRGKNVCSHCQQYYNTA